MYFALTVMSKNMTEYNCRGIKNTHRLRISLRLRFLKAEFK